MKMYIVIRSGVYRHEILGAYDDFNSATGRAMNLCKQEPDDYHSFDILEIEFDKDIDDGKVVAVIKREGNTVKTELRNNSSSLV